MMDKKQKRLLIVLALIFSLFVVVVVSVYPFTFVTDNGGGNGDDPPDPPVPPDPSEDPPDAPILNTIIPKPSIDGKICLRWDSVSNADRYAVYRKLDEGSYKLLGDPITINHYDDLVLDNGVYRYKLKAGNINSDYSDYSNEEDITVQMPSVPEQPYMNQLTYEIIGNTIEVYIDWEEVDCDSYKVYRSIDYGDYVTIVDGLTITSYSEVLIEVGVYMYKVSAINMFGESELSVFVSIEITEDGVPDEPDEPVDYIMLYILLIVLGVLVVPTIVLKNYKK